MSLGYVLKDEGASKSSLFLYKKKYKQKKSRYLFFCKLIYCLTFFKNILSSIRKQLNAELAESKFDLLVDPKKEMEGHLRFEISMEKMNELLAHRLICAADVRCLDANSKQCLKILCLETCLYSPAREDQQT